jgi:AcrR family transcriptional regulator
VRKRRPAAETRDELLAAAEVRLRDMGPTALKLDDVAADVGVSRQTILHHFGSRDGLMRALVERAWTGLFADLAGLAESAGTLEPAQYVELIDEVARRKGNARLGAWLLLSGKGLPDSVFEGAAAGLTPDLGDRGFGMLLLGAALFGDAIFGTRLRQVLGLPDSDEDRAAFRAWLARLPLEGSSNEP